MIARTHFRDECFHVERIDLLEGEDWFSEEGRAIARMGGTSHGRAAW